MIDIPLGKALVPIEVPYGDKCLACEVDIEGDAHVVCCSADREDGKNVIFKLVDYPEEEKI